MYMYMYMYTYVYVYYTPSVSHSLSRSRSLSHAHTHTTLPNRTVMRSCLSIFIPLSMARELRAGGRDAKARVVPKLS